MSAMWCSLVFLLCLAAGSRPLSMTEFVVPAALQVGEDAELLCQYELLKNESEKALFVKWWRTPLNNTDDEPHTIYQRVAGYSANIFPRFQNSTEILKNDGIKLLNVTPEASGIYECEVSNINEVRKHKKLVVYSIGSGPLLSVNVTEEEQASAQVTCEAFDVAPRPDIVITLNGETVETYGYVNDLTNGYYEVHKHVNLPLPEANNGEFRCEIFFEDQDVPHAPFIASQTFVAPTVSTPEAEEPATEPTAATSQPNDSGSNKIGHSWILLTSFAFLILLQHNGSN